MTTTQVAPIKYRFARDTAKHVLEIRHDDGLYRHIVCKKPETCCMMYSITTTPGRLIYAGDMGCFVFERLPDMFQFFRPDKTEREPNYSYWHEKLVATDRDGSTQHCVERFRENLECYIEDQYGEELEEIRNFISQAVGHFEYAGPQAAYEMVNDFSLSTSPRREQFFQDFFERSDKVFTLRYEWACHAIPHAIKLYDAKRKPV